MTLCHIRMMRIFYVLRSWYLVKSDFWHSSFCLQVEKKHRMMALCFVCNPRQHQKKLLRLFIFYSPSVCLDMSQILFVMS